MNAMKTGTKNWGPMLVATNANIKQGWALAWSFGVIGNHTGMTIYSGLDTDAIDNTQLNPNDEITELALQLKAQFRTTPDPTCASNCSGPSQGIKETKASCKLAKRVSSHWVHGRVSIWLKCGPATGVTASAVVPSSETVLASGKEQRGLIHLRVHTRLLPTNHVSRLAVAYVYNQQAQSIFFRLKVDNTPPRLLNLRTSSGGTGRLVSFRVSERSQMRIVGGGSTYRHWVKVGARRLIHVRLPGSLRHARLILRDRADNTLVRKLVW